MANLVFTGWMTTLIQLGLMEEQMTNHKVAYSLIVLLYLSILKLE